MDGRAGAGRGRGRGRARAPEGGRGRGRARGPEGGRGRGRARGVPEPQVNVIVQENLNPNFAVPQDLLNQNLEVDHLNQELSLKYMDIQNLKDSIVEFREVVPNDKLSHMKQIEVSLNQYREMRSQCAELRNKILRMNPPGMPFGEPEGFDVLP